MAETLAFSLSLYREDAVRGAAAAYDGVVEVAVRVEGQDVLAELGAPPEGISAEELADHFANHVLLETIHRHRAEGGQGVGP